MEKTLRQIKGNNPPEKTRQGDNPFKNKEGRQPLVFRLQIYRYKGATLGFYV
jgi:hypothetical protein